MDVNEQFEINLDGRILTVQDANTTNWLRQYKLLHVWRGLHFKIFDGQEFICDLYGAVDSERQFNWYADDVADKFWVDKMGRLLQPPIEQLIESSVKKENPTLF
jgi:hypothetical protein